MYFKHLPLWNKIILSSIIIYPTVYNIKILISLDWNNLKKNQIFIFQFLNVHSHPTSCASMAEIMSVLFFHTMRYKVSSPKDASNDRFILSKGHAAPILYAGN